LFIFEEIWIFMNILIIGATSGIGRALAENYIKEGHKVSITGRREDKLLEISKLNEDRVYPVRHDIRDMAQFQDLLTKVKNKFGSIDLIIVSSGIGKFNKNLEWPICESVLKTNILGVTNILTASFRFFKNQSYGHLVNISSVAAHIGAGLNPSYNASKAYQANFMEGLWMKARKTKDATISITDIRPGFVDTKLAQGETFWKADTHTAARQIIRAIKKKKRRAYITKRWGLIAILLKWMPRKLALKFF